MTAPEPLPPTFTNFAPVKKYDTELGGYKTDISGNRLKGAPKHGTETVFDWSARSKEVDDYYSDGRGIVA